MLADNDCIVDTIERDERRRTITQVVFRYLTVLSLLFLPFYLEVLKRLPI